MKFDDAALEKEDRRRIQLGVESHAETLRALLVASGDRAERYLLLTNSGGVIVLLGFMGASQEIRNSPTAWVAIACLCGGVFLCGALTAMTFHVRNQQFMNWIRDADKFFACTIDQDEMYSNLNRHMKRWEPWPVVTGYLSFAAFIVGATLAISQMLGLAIEHSSTLAIQPVHETCANDCR